MEENKNLIKDQINATISNIILSEDNLYNICRVIEQNFNNNNTIPHKNKCNKVYNKINKIVSKLNKIYHELQDLQYLIK